MYANISRVTQKQQEFIFRFTEFTESCLKWKMTLFTLSEKLWFILYGGIRMYRLMGMRRKMINVEL